MSKYWRTSVLVGIAVCLFLIPNLFWGNLYIVGGDDARLYYQYPLEYLKNFSFNVMSGNTLGGNLGYTPVSYSAPIIAVLAVFRVLFPNLNTQLFTYGIIFSLGFIFFYLFLREWIPKKSTFYFWISIVASLAYIFSLYITRTFFYSQFISIFLLMVLPGCLYFFVSGLKGHNITRVIASSLLYSIFGSSVFGFPWLLPIFVTLIPFFVYLAVRFGKYFWKMTGIFIGVFLLCNVYWVIHYIIPILSKTGETDYIATLSTNSFIQQNNELIASLVHLNSPVHQVVQHLRITWQDRQGVTILEAVGALYLFVILSAGVLLGAVRKEIRLLYITATSGLLLAMLFITPNFGDWNLWLFQFLNAHVPFFGIFRNMYDKFALAMAFQSAFALWAAFAVLGETKIKRAYLYVAVLIVCLITIVRSVPYMVPAASTTRISGLNQDYTDLTRYIQRMNTSHRFVWYPLTFGGYVYISDLKSPDHFYVGVSPLQIFARASDLAGFYGLQTPGDPQLHWNVLALLREKEFRAVGEIFKRQNVGYVIVNHEKMPDGGSFVLEQFDFVKSQNEEYLRTILGEKIRDFGTGYSLYEISPEFRAPTVSLNDTEIPFRRDRDGVYDIGPFTVTKKSNLFLMEPYSRLWIMERTDGGKHSSVEGPNLLAHGYGNSWEMDPGRLGSQAVRIRAEFWPNRLIVPSVVISITSGVVAFLYCVINLMKKKKRI